MKDTLCLLINTKYDHKETKYNDEVQHDTDTVLSYFGEEYVATITVDACAKAKNILKEKKTTYQKQITNGIESSKLNKVCVVINTHGRPGVSDLNDEVVKLLVSTLPEKVTLTYIVALQCNGFKVNTIEDQKEHRERMHQPTGNLKDKSSSLSILAAKLNKLSTVSSRNFCLLPPCWTLIIVMLDTAKFFFTC